MDGRIPLEDHLAGWSAGNAERSSLVTLVLAMAGAGREIAGLVSLGPLSGDDSSQSHLPGKANAIVETALAGAGVAFLSTEHLKAPHALKTGAPFAVTLDQFAPRALETDSTCGTLFSVLPAAADAESSFRQPGSKLLAAGYIVYGPHVAMVLTLGEGTNVYTLDPASGRFLLTEAKADIPRRTREFHINASNSRHWSDPVRAYIADAVAGAEGPRGEDYNMRWTASIVGASYRILSRGGIYLYPSDTRPDYTQGRLHLLHEVNPIAFIVEQAGGLATNGKSRVLDIVPDGIHQRTPFIFGSRNEVERIVRYKTDRHGIVERSPLFGKRGLFRV